MRRLGRPERKGLGKNQLLLWGFLFLLAGIFSRSILQNQVLQMNTLTGQQLLEVMSESKAAMAAATAALVLQALETCAVPIFAFLLADAFANAKSRKMLALFLLITALCSEIPYNLAMSGKFLNMSSRNPAVAMVLGVAVLYFFHRYQENSFSNVLVKLIIGVAAVLWAVLLKVEHGEALLVMIMAMWAFRNKSSLRALFCAVAVAACTLVSPFYIVSAMGILPVHLYREEENREENPVAIYATYPVLLLAVGVLSNLI
jgi:hypothetical protein